MEIVNSVSEKRPRNEDENDEQNQKMLPETIEITQAEVAKVPTFGKALLLICGIVNFGFSFGFPTSLSVYFLDWQDSFHENRATTASIHATCVGTLNTAAIIPGLLMSRYGDRVTLLLGCCLAGLGMVLSSFATNIPHMVVTTGVIFGMGCCMINLPTIPCITSVFTKNQSIYISSLCFGSGLVNTVLPFFYTFLSTEYGWRGSHLITAGLILQTCISSLVITSFRPSGVEEETIENTFETDESCGESKQSKGNKETQLLKTGFFLDGISVSSLHSSTFGSQILAPRPRKNTLDSCKHSTENGLALIKATVSKGSTTIVSPEEEFCDKKSIFLRLKSSHPFLFDPMFILEIFTSSFCLSAIYSTIALMMDFTKTKGYTDNSVSVFLVFLAFLFSMFGKMFTGVMNLVPLIHSFHLLISYGIVCSIALISLIYTQEYISLCVEFALTGFVLGGLASLYPKCVLDMNTVDARTYPLALSLNNTMLGFFDVTLPVIMGYTVDIYHTYAPALYLYSSMCIVLTLLVVLLFYIKNKRELMCSRQEI